MSIPVSTGKTTIRSPEKILPTLLEHTFSRIAVLTPAGIVLETSQPNTQAQGSPFWETAPWNEALEIQKQLQDAISTLCNSERTAQATTNQWTRLTVEISNELIFDLSIQPIKNESGEVMFLIAEAWDISHLKLGKDKHKQTEIPVVQNTHIDKRTKKALQKRNRELESKIQSRTQELIASHLALQDQKRILQVILDSMGDSVIVVNRQWEILASNPAAERMFGLQSTQKSLEACFLDRGVFLSDGFTPCPLEQHPLVRSMRGESADFVEMLIRRSPHSEDIYTETTIRPLVEKTGAIQGGVCVFRDVTERKRIEEALRLREQAIVANVSGIVIADVRLPDMPLVYVNPAFERQTGYPASEVLGKNCRFLQGNDRDQPEIEMLQTAIRNGTNCTVTLRNYRKDGTLFWNELTISPIYNPHRNMTHFVGILVDVTERKRSELALAESEAKFRRLVEEGSDLIFTFSKEGIFTYMSPNSIEILGYDSSEMIGQPFALFTHPDDIPVCEAFFQKLVETGEKQTGLEFRAKAKDGSWRWMIGNNSPMRDDTGNIMGWQGIAREVTAQKQVEAKLKASLQEKDVLLKEIHHRVKNNMQMVCSLLSLQASYLQDPTVLIPFTESQNRIKAMALVHERLYQSDGLARINFREYVQKFAIDLIRSYGTSSPIHLSFEVDDLELELDTALSCGLIINELICNAVKYAFPDNRSGEIGICFRQDETGQYCLSVTDNGIGIADEIDILNRESLGLQIVHAFVQKLRGTLSLNCQDGSQFTIVFR